MRVFFALILLLLAGCDMNTPEDVREAVQRLADREAPAPLPELSLPLLAEDGVRQYEVFLSSGGAEQVWIALPAVEENATTDAEPMPCAVLLPLSMDRSLGGHLGAEDWDQLLLFARMGVAAVAFDVPGGFGAEASEAAVQAEMARYIESDGGLRTARQVLEFVRTRIPGIDPERVWVLGEGTAGTLALHLAGRDNRVSAVVAFDPVVDMLALIEEEEALGAALQGNPELREFLRKQSVFADLETMRCPLLLYHDAFRHGKNFADIDRLYLEGLRREKDVTLIDTINVDPAHAGLASRVSRSLRWLETAGMSKK